ncbi:MAG: hypothetical protein MRJ96_11990 [Nitrospirales bacterium]|nr:hypothetical protein [Nitrospira sp.]MDR4502161.1 hypothetical protein [Nitrospirales bacterium]
MNAVRDLAQSLKSFDDCEIRVYTRFATEWRDQRLTEGSAEEVAFWNAIVSMLLEERQRRATEVRRLEMMYRTGKDLKEPDLDDEQGHIDDYASY